MWQPDGWNATTRIGVLTPHADVGPESELKAMAPDHVGIHAARVPFGGMAVGGGMDPTVPLAPVRAFADPPHVDDATERLAAAPLHAIGFGFTSSAYLIGAEAEQAMIERLTDRAHGIPVVATGAAIIEALRLLNVRRLSLVHPPWFDAELNDFAIAYYEAAGFEVLAAASCGLPSDQRAITPGALHARVAEQPVEGSEGTVIDGNGFRAVGVISALEQTTGSPVVTANQALLWAALRAAGDDPSAVSGYGRLFTRK